MIWIIDVLVGIGLVAFLAGILLSAFAKDSKNIGTDAWKWKNILLIVAGVGLFLLFGCLFLWDFLQEQQTSDLIMGLLSLAIGAFTIWNSSSELRQTNPSPKKKAYLSLMLGMLLTISMASLFVLQHQNNGSISFEDLILAGFGIFVSIVAALKVKQIRTALIEQ